jgi:hypothetical protein
MNGRLKRPEHLVKGDIVEIRWIDTQSLDRLTTDDLKTLSELDTTRSYGVVLKLMKTCVVIAHELGDPGSDGWHIEQLPYRMITGCRVFGHAEVKVEV